MSRYLINKIELLKITFCIVIFSAVIFLHGRNLYSKKYQTKIYFESGVLASELNFEKTYFEVFFTDTSKFFFKNGNPKKQIIQLKNLETENPLNRRYLVTDFYEKDSGKVFCKREYLYRMMSNDFKKHYPGKRDFKILSEFGSRPKDIDMFGNQLDTTSNFKANHRFFYEIRLLSRKFNEDGIMKESLDLTDASYKKWGYRENFIMVSNGKKSRIISTRIERGELALNKKEPS
ncbi:MAG: hypothetical protein N4A44_00740 [Alphaproteobacteria bacterium]|nr:hypothetical protein [Alphaproteobacteria bacterium]